MSKQNVVVIDLRIRGDKDFLSRVKALSANDADGLVKLGAEAGFKFSTSELLEVIGMSRHSDELSENQLEQVAGGALNAFQPPQSPILVHFSITHPPDPHFNQKKLNIPSISLK